MSQLREVPPLLVGDSPRLHEIRGLIAKMARSTFPVLLLGETGTGKEVVAHSIHALGPGGPFVPIDCTLPAMLLETELFGHTRGAFTGAVANKAGLLELAEGGTAFFDEVGDFPPEIQVKLLRVLQDKEIRPLGSLFPHKANFRVIAATNRDLAREVERGNFRRDLYYRLNVVKITLPPLRDHKEDVPALAAHFLARYGPHHQLSRDLLDAMARYDWPGNVRELENCIRRMVAINSGPYLHTADLPSAFAGALAAESAYAQPARAAAAAAACPIRPLEHLERQAIREALAHTAGDRTQAAHLLGIGRTTLYRRMKRYSL